MDPVESGDWWVSFYDEMYADLLLAGSEDEASDAVRFLTSVLGLSRGARVLDQGCGVGWLALPLAASGMRPLGVDVSAGYVGRAGAEARARGLDVELLVADAGSFVAPEPMDAVVNWRTSFGYCEDDSRNARILRCAFDSLAPGGRFALDYPNVARVLRDFQPRIEQRFATDAGEFRLVRESAADLVRGMLDQRWTWTLPGGRVVERHGSTRLYLPREITALLEAVGFRDVAFHGGVRGESFDGNSPRCIAIAERPKAGA